MISPRRRREDVAVPLRRRLPAETPRVLRKALTEQSRSPFGPTLVECLREVFAKPSRCLREAFTQWARRGAVAKGSRRLHERFVKTSRALKASRRDREAFAKPSRSLHPFPRRLRVAILKASRGARGVFIWKRFVKERQTPDWDKHPAQFRFSLYSQKKIINHT